VRILVIHNRYRIRGGEDESTEMEIALLRAHGHEVTDFFEDNQRIDQLSVPNLALRTVWSQESYWQLRRLIGTCRPHIAYFQNTFPLISPAAYYAAKAEGVATVQTLRNYRLLCPNALFFRDGRPCEACLGRRTFWPGVLHACYRQNRLASFTVATMLMTHRALHTWQRAVDIYIALTEFARQKFIEGGIPAAKIFVKPNFVHPDPGVSSGRGRYALFVGRLFPEKGLDTLLAAWKRLATPVPLKIVGEGPMADRVVEACQVLPEVTWLGRQTMAQVSALMGEARYLVFPSTWYEGLPRTIIEAFAKGIPVVASNLGAMSTLVEDGRTGMHFAAGDPEALATSVQWAWSHPQAMAEMGHRARQEYEAKYTAERSYERLMTIWAQLLGLEADGQVSPVRG
jgi:glycosyltransferase involved in cell wall biosynthesis